MSEHIARLCGKLRIKLHGIDRRLEALEANAMATSEEALHAVESQLDRVEQRIYDNRIIEFVLMPPSVAEARLSARSVLPRAAWGSHSSLRRP